MSKLNYEVVLIVGIFPAVNVMFFTVLAVILTPILCYLCYKGYRRRTEQRRRSRAILKAFVSKPYEIDRFRGIATECSICLGDF